MTYRAALNRCWAVVSLLWIAWCLYWPFYAQRQDAQAITADTAETYKLCLQQKGMTAAGCAADRDAYIKLDKRLTSPPGQSAYQSFAGARWQDALSLMILLSLLPVVFGYVLVRSVLEFLLWFARTKTKNLPIRS